MNAISNDSLDLLHADMAAANMAPTWVHVSEFVAREPAVTYRPWLWRWDDVIPLLMRAGDLITPERGAERRSMEHVNPDLKHSFSASHTIATAFQLVRAGETAPAHRHMAAAIRFAAKSKGGEIYTRVEGERLMMQENDLLLTPSWTWHEHANETGEDIVWLDALDFPLVNLMQASLFEPGESGQVAARPADRSDDPAHHPVMRYPWTDMRDRLERLRGEAGNPFDGILLAYVNPLTSGPTLPTMSCRAQLLPGGFRGAARRATASTVCYVIEGQGESVIAGTRFRWAPGDVFVIPNWAWHEHASPGDDAILFSITDAPVMQTLGMDREEALAATHQKIDDDFDG